MELKRRDRRRRFWNLLTVAALIALLVFLGVYVDRVTPVRVDGGLDDSLTTVSFTRGQVQWLSQNYNQSVENGFCLFGSIDGSEVVVQDVEFVDNPWSQSKHAMSFSCIPQILVRSNDLVLDSDYRFLGIIHTHPNTAYLSDVDQNTFSKVESVVELFGVYNGDVLNVFDRPGGPEARLLLRAS